MIVGCLHVEYNEHMVDERWPSGLVKLSTKNEEKHFKVMIPGNRIHERRTFKNGIQI